MVNAELVVRPSPDPFSEVIDDKNKADECDKSGDVSPALGARLVRRGQLWECVELLERGWHRGIQLFEERVRRVRRGVHRRSGGREQGRAKEGEIGGREAGYVAGDQLPAKLGKCAEDEEVAYHMAHYRKPTTNPNSHEYEG